MSQFYSKYQGGGPSAVPAGFMQAASQSGQNIAAGLEKFGEGIASYRKNKKEKRQAEAIFEDLRFREDPDIVNFSVDPKRLTRIDEGKGTLEDYLVAANSIGSKIEEIEKFKNTQRQQDQFDAREKGVADRFTQQIELDRKRNKAIMAEKDAKLKQHQADLESYRTQYSDADIYDPEAYANALAKTKSQVEVSGATNYFGGTSPAPEELDLLLNMSDEEKEATFRRPKSAIEKSLDALNVEGISVEQADRVMKNARRESGANIEFVTDEVSGNRFAVNRDTGVTMASGYDPRIAGEKPMTEGEKNRKLRIQRYAQIDNANLRNDLIKTEDQLLKLQTDLAEVMDVEFDNAPKIAGIKNNIKVKQQRLIRIENQIMKSQGKSKEEIQELRKNTNSNPSNPYDFELDVNGNVVPPSDPTITP